MDVGLYAVSIKKSQTIEGGGNVQFNILALVQYFENFVRAAPNQVSFYVDIVMASNSSGAASAQVAVAIALQSVNT